MENYYFTLTNDELKTNFDLAITGDDSDLVPFSDSAVNLVYDMHPIDPLLHVNAKQTEMGEFDLEAQFGQDENNARGRLEVQQGTKQLNFKYDLMLLNSAVR